MGSRGPKPGESAQYTDSVSAKVTPELKRRIMLHAYHRKAHEPSLPPRWGQSDLIREILEAYFAALPPEKTADKA